MQTKKFGHNANKKMQNYHKKKTTITNLSYNLIKISYNKFPQIYAKKNKKNQ